MSAISPWCTDYNVIPAKIIGAVANDLGKAKDERKQALELTETGLGRVPAQELNKA